MFYVIHASLLHDGSQLYACFELKSTTFSVLLHISCIKSNTMTRQHVKILWPPTQQSFEACPIHWLRKPPIPNLVLPPKGFYHIPLLPPFIDWSLEITHRVTSFAGYFSREWWPFARVTNESCSVVVIPNTHQPKNHKSRRDSRSPLVSLLY